MKLENKRIRELLRKEAKLEALENGGVSNWDWYEESLKDYSANEEKEEAAEQVMEEIISILSSGAYEVSERGAGVGFPEATIQEAVDCLNQHVTKFNMEML